MESVEYSAVFSYTTFFNEDTEDLTGLFVVPSDVLGRGNITGYVLSAANEQGKLEWINDPTVNISLGELIDVEIINPIASQIIIFDSIDSEWKNGTLQVVIPGDAFEVVGDILNVRFDGIININGSNELQLTNVTNAKLVNSEITLTGVDGIINPGSVSLGNSIGLSVDATVIRTTGGQTISGNLTLDELLLRDNTTNTIGLSAPATVSNYPIVFPETQGINGQLLENDGSGNLSWSDPIIIPSAFSWKQSVRVTTTGPQTLSTDFENGDTIDGVVLVTLNRILIKDQASGVENGIYTVNLTGAPSRAADMPSGSSADGTAMMVSEGTSNADTGWVETSIAITGTDPLSFVQFITTVSPVSPGADFDILLSDGLGGFLSSTLSTFQMIDSATIPNLNVSSPSFTIQGVAGTGVSLGSALTFVGGSSSNVGFGGNVSLETGSGGSTSGNSADFNVTTGTVTSGVTGLISMLTENGTSSSGDISINPGDSTTTIGGIGGTLSLSAGDSEATVPGSDISITPGTTSGPGILNGSMRVIGNIRQDANTITTTTAMKEIARVNVSGSDTIQPIVTDGTYAYAASERRLAVVDISRPDNLTQIFSGFNFFPFNTGETIIISANILFVDLAGSATGRDSISSVDISNPHSPVLLQTFDLETIIRKFKIYSNIFYGCGNPNALIIMDISNPADMKIVDLFNDGIIFELPDRISNSLFQTSGPGDILRRFNVTEITNPILTATRSGSTFLDNTQGLSVRGNYAYTWAVGGNNFAIWDISSGISSPPIGNLTSFNETAREIRLSGNTVYVGGGNMAAVDIEDITNPIVVSNFNEGATRLSFDMLGKFFVTGDNDTPDDDILTLNPTNTELLSCSAGMVKTTRLWANNISVGTLNNITSLTTENMFLNELTVYKSVITQLTSTVTSVAINSQSGKIQMFSNSMASKTDLTFVVTNSFSLENSVILTTVQSFDGVGTSFPYVYSTSIANGSFSIVLQNLSTSAMTNNILILAFIIL